MSSMGGKTAPLRKRPSSSSSRAINSRAVNAFSQTREAKFPSGLVGVDTKDKKSAGLSTDSSTSEDAEPHAQTMSDSHTHGSQDHRNPPTTEPLHRKGNFKRKDAAPRQESANSGDEPASDSHPGITIEPSAEAHHSTPRNVMKRLVQGGYKLLLWMCPPSLFPLTGSIYLKLVCSMDAWVRKYSRNRRIMRGKRKHDIMQV